MFPEKIWGGSRNYIIPKINALLKYNGSHGIDIWFDAQGVKRIDIGSITASADTVWSTSYGGWWSVPNDGTTAQRIKTLSVTNNLQSLDLTNYTYPQVRLRFYGATTNTSGANIQGNDISVIY